MHLVTLNDMASEVRRELMLRRKVYEKWVTAGTMTQGDADRHMSRLSACGELLDEIAASKSADVKKLARDRQL